MNKSLTHIKYLNVPIPKYEIYVYSYSLTNLDRCLAEINFQKLKLRNDRELVQFNGYVRSRLAMVDINVQVALLDLYLNIYLFSLL